MQAKEEVAPRRGREGGRWINERPTSVEFGEWFEKNVKLDPSLDPKDYVGGVVLIPAVDTKAKRVEGFSNTGHPIISEGEELSYIPYAKVETRINYYWDLLDAHPEWVGVIENVPAPRMPIDFVNTVEKRDTSEGGWTTRELRTPSAMTAMVHQLPEGFSVMAVPVGQGYTYFVCSTIRVSIFKADENGEPKGRPLRTGRGTKQVPMLKGRTTVWADDSTLMKAETGALGRALGFAGIFVIPGSGVATAEDVQEALSQGATPVQGTPEQNAGPAAPTVAPVLTGAESAAKEEEDLRTRAIQLYRTLSEGSPDRATEFGEWMRSRNLKGFNDARGAMLRGVVKKLEKATDEAFQTPEESSDASPAKLAEPDSSPTPGAGDQ